MNRRRILAAVGGKPLPYLRRVAYLESHGTEYFISDVVATADVAYRIKFQFLSRIHSDDQVIGARDNAPINELDLNRDSRKLFFQHRGRDVNFNYVFNVAHDYTALNGFLLDNDSGIEIANIPAQYSTSVHYGIFCLSSNDVAARMPNARIWFVQFSRNGIVFENLIPVLDLSGRPAMYDEVSGQFFYNQGSGEFTWGELDAT